MFTSPPAAPGAGATLGARATGYAAAERWAATLRPSPGAPNAFPQATPTPPSPATTTQDTSMSAEATEPPDVVPGASETAGASPPDALPVRFERESGSPTPWIALGGIGGVSLVVTLVALQRAWLAGRGRGRRGG